MKFKITENKSLVVFRGSKTKIWNGVEWEDVDTPKEVTESLDKTFNNNDMYRKQ